MNPFFTSEIEQLNNLYSRMQFSFVFLYGRYGTGKTELVREFCADRPSLFFSAQETDPVMQLEAFRRTCIRIFTAASVPASFADWFEAFRWVSDQSFLHRMILILDEFQYLSQHSESFHTAFLHAVHHEFPSGKVFLIVTSSSSSYARSLMEEPGTDPFDQITARASLSFLPYYSCRPYLESFSPHDQILLYGITGGLPSYIKKLDPSRNASENIQDLFFSSDAPFLTTPLMYLNQEVREKSTYNYLLELIAGGMTKSADIAAAAGIGTNKCAKYLATLMQIGMLRKEFPAEEDIRKRVRYVPADHMLRFWYGYVYPNLSAILFGDGADCLQTEVLPFLDTFLLHVFESICAEYLMQLSASGQTPFPCPEIGSWWNGGTKCEPFFRIPIVAVGTTEVLLGACHWSDKPASLNLLEKLQADLPCYAGLKRYCCIFSGSSFSPELKEAASASGHVWLIDLEDVVGPSLRH